MQYILKLSIALTVVYLFYWLLLRRLTFHNWNRWYLLLYSAVCFLIPMVDVGSLLQRRGWIDATVVNYIPSLTNAGKAYLPVERKEIVWAVVSLLVAAGTVLMLIRMLVQYWSLRRLLSSAVLLSDGDVKLFHVEKKIIPFSTGNAIYVNRHLHQDHELREIIRHEFIHIKQRHSLDLWWSELLCITNWYNPFAWLIRKAIRQNLEYIADHQVLQSGLDRKQYQYLLLKVTGVAPFSFTSNFNFSSLKKRIVMMNKNKSANAHLMRFLFILPLLVVVLLAFRKVTITNTSVTVSNITDTVPVKTIDIDAEFKKRNIKQIMITEKGDKAKVTLRDGTVKSFDLTKADEKAAFEKAYGDLEPPAPPLAPRPSKLAAPPAPPAPVKGQQPAQPATPPAPPVPVEAPQPSQPAQPPAPPVKVKNVVAVATPDNDISIAADEVRMVYASEVNVSGGTVVGKGNAHAQVQETPVRRTVMSGDLIAIAPAASAGMEADKVPLEEQPLLELTNSMTSDDLDRIARELAGRGYTLRFKNVNFDNGVLTSVVGSISYDGKLSKFTADSFKKLSIYLYKGNPDKFHIMIHNGRVSLTN
ncbi:M56 family metallopeptidase [Paraflavitalea sp. CAU 1676]|uniref:M56 family metallopeptidase n=1 Tax=Paraflavitalea sp. CAU 1676 TaxID=3032598 RepID=UPI0023DB517B|nr:M56 family metallopeptidase [Paraflavitalea sp. CAU 1676]MDF2193107.1 M56 family metallopeptidase [Paraflavitalea sp. CAU 1676]